MLLLSLSSIYWLYERDYRHRYKYNMPYNGQLSSPMLNKSTRIIEREKIACIYLPQYAAELTLQSCFCKYKKTNIDKMRRVPQRAKIASSFTSSLTSSLSTLILLISTLMPALARLRPIKIGKYIFFSSKLIKKLKKK